jgi:pyruvate carboxylase subunit B
MTGMAYQRAAEAGVNVVDCDISPFSEGTGHPATESVVYAFKGTEWDTGLDMELLMELRDYFRTVFDKYRHLMRIEALRTDPSIVMHQIPGGMMSNLVSQLEMQKAKDKLDAVLKEVPKVREELGYPPLVTPTSQVVGVQAVMNVLFGRYKNIPTETKDYVRGMYGLSPAPISDEIKERILGPDWRSQIVTGRPADSLKPEWEARRKELIEMGLLKKEEDALTYAIYPQIGLKFLKGEVSPEFTSESLPLPIDHKATRAFVRSFFPEVQDIYLSEKDPDQMVKDALAAIPIQPSSRFDGPQMLKVEVNGNSYDVTVFPPGTEGGMEIVPSPQRSPKRPPQGSGPVRKAETLPSAKGESIICPMQGTIYKVLVKEGVRVRKGQPIIILEAMKMENEIHATKDGMVEKVFVSVGQEVGSGNVLAILS